MLHVSCCTFVLLLQLKSRFRGSSQSRSKSRSGSRFSCRGKEENLLPDLLFDLLWDFPRNLLLSYFWATLFFRGFLVLWLTRAVTSEDRNFLGEFCCEKCRFHLTTRFTKTSLGIDCAIQALVSQNVALLKRLRLRSVCACVSSSKTQGSKTRVVL